MEEKHGGIALTIEAVTMAAALNTGGISNLSIRSPTNSEDGREQDRSFLEEWRVRVVDNVFDGLTRAVDAKKNNVIDSAFMEKLVEVGDCSVTVFCRVCDIRKSKPGMPKLLQKPAQMGPSV